MKELVNKRKNGRVMPLYLLQCLFTIGLELNVVMVLIKSPFTFIFVLRLTVSWITQWGAGRDYLVTPMAPLYMVLQYGVTTCT